MTTTQHNTPDKSELWRYGIVETYSPVFQAYIRTNDKVTIKPSVSVLDLEKTLSLKYGTPVHLFVPDF